MRVFKRRKSQGITVRWSILKNFTVLIVLIFMFFLIAMISIPYSELTILSNKLVTKATAELESDFNGVFDPLVKHIRIAADWGRAGNFGYLSRSDMINTFVPVLKEYPQLTAVRTGDTQGNGLKLLKTQQGWIMEQVQMDSKGGKHVLHIWTTPCSRFPQSGNH